MFWLLRRNSHVILNRVRKASKKKCLFNFYSLMQPWLNWKIWFFRWFGFDIAYICYSYVRQNGNQNHAKFSIFLFLAYTHRCTDHRRLSKYTKRKRSAFSVRCSFLNICARFILYIPGSFYQLVNCHYISRHGTHTHLYKSHFITAKRNCV